MNEGLGFQGEAGLALAGAGGLPGIDWGELRLDEPKAKPKEFAKDELQALIDATPKHWHDFICFASR